MAGLFSAVSIVSAEVDGTPAFAGDLPASELALAIDGFDDVQVRISCMRSMRLGIRNDGSVPLLVCGRAQYANGFKMFGQQLAPGEVLNFEEAEPCMFCLDHVEER